MNRFALNFNAFKESCGSPIAEPVTDGGDGRWPQAIIARVSIERLGHRPMTVESL